MLRREFCNKCNCFLKVFRFSFAKIYVIFIKYQLTAVTEMEYSLRSFNGQRPDPISGHYHLGNGYRVYCPAVRRFNAPDNISPFGAGGINPYAYCAGDPVNRTDPSGHFSPGQVIGMVLGGVAGFALSVLTEGAAMPVVLTLMATVAGDAAIGAGTELATEAINGQHVNWNEVGWAAGYSAVASLAGFSLGRLSKLKGTSNRPLGGGMVEGENQVSRQGSVAAVTATRRPVVSVSQNTLQMIREYERNAYMLARERLGLPMTTSRFRRPRFGNHRLMIQRSPDIPVYSQELQQLAPIPGNLQSRLNYMYRSMHAGTELTQYRGDPATFPHGVVTSNLPASIEELVPTASPFSVHRLDSPPPAYEEVDLAGIPSYEESSSHELLDFHYMTHL